MTSTDSHLAGPPATFPAQGIRPSIMSRTELQDRGPTCEPASDPRLTWPPVRKRGPHHVDFLTPAVQSRGNNDTLSFTENASECLRYSSSSWGAGPAVAPGGPQALRVWEPRDIILSAHSSHVRRVASRLSFPFLFLSGWVRHVDGYIYAPYVRARRKAEREKERERERESARALA